MNDLRKHKIEADDPAEFHTLPPEEQAALKAWIAHAIKPTRRLLTSRISYSLKHDFERIGFSIANDQFKGAILAIGYPPQDETARNWVFKIACVGAIDKGHIQLEDLDGTR